MRIALVMPPIFYPSQPPVGITAIKSYLQQFGHEVRCLDLNAGERCLEILKETSPAGDGPEMVLRSLGLLLAEDLERALDENAGIFARVARLHARRPPAVERLGEVLLGVKEILDRAAAELCGTGYEIVGCSSFESTNACALYLLRQVKRLNPETKTVLGGPTASAESDVVEQHFDHIDFIIAGHGEVPFRKLIESGCRSSRRVVRASRAEVRAEGVNSYPFLDYSDFDIDRYSKRELGVTVQNGCVYGCRFCEWQSHFEFPDTRRAEVVFSEMAHLNDKHGISRFHMCTAQINPVARELAHLVAADSRGLTWYGPACVDPQQFAGEDAAILKEGGLDGPRFGVESGSDRVLRLMRKGHESSDVLPNMRSLDRLGIPSEVMFIAGFPGEEDADHRQTCDLLEAILQQTELVQAVSFPYVLIPHGNGGLRWFESRFGAAEKIPLVKDALFSYEHEFVLPALGDHRSVIAARHGEHREIIALHRGSGSAG